MARPYGVAVAYGRDHDFRHVGVIGPVEVSAAGNAVLRVGRLNTEVRAGVRPGGWSQTEHVVLEPDEARRLIAALEAALRGEEEAR